MLLLQVYSSSLNIKLSSHTLQLQLYIHVYENKLVNVNVKLFVTCNTFLRITRGQQCALGGLFEQANKRWMHFNYLFVKCTVHYVSCRSHCFVHYVVRLFRKYFSMWNLAEVFPQSSCVVKLSRVSTPLYPGAKIL